MIKLLYLSLGGVLGTLLRYFSSSFINNYMGLPFPYGTLFVNIMGSFLIGLMWGFSELITLSPQIRLLLFVGFLGSFTTFSTFALENFSLIRDQEYKYAISNILISNIAAIIMVFLGILLSKYLISLSH